MRFIGWLTVLTVGLVVLLLAFGDDIGLEEQRAWLVREIQDAANSLTP